MTYDNNYGFEHNNPSIYIDEDYEKLTGGKYGKEIFVPHNENKDNVIFSAVLDEDELRSKIDTEDVVEYFFKTVKKTVKCEDVLIRQIGYTGLSSYIEDDPINLGIMAPTSEGKTYPVEETLKFFPKDDVYKIGSMSTKVLVRKKGVLVNKNFEPIEEKLKVLHKQKAKTKDQDEKDQLSEEIDKLYEGAKTLIDLRGKILVFLESPDKVCFVKPHTDDLVCETIVRGILPKRHPDGGLESSSVYVLVTDNKFDFYNITEIANRYQILVEF
jgi:hypothetical protein